MAFLTFLQRHLGLLQQDGIQVLPSPLKYPPILALGERARAKVGVGQRRGTDAGAVVAVEVVAPPVQVSGGVGRTGVRVPKTRGGHVQLQ